MPPCGLWELLLVVNFWTRLKVRDIASARPFASPTIVRFFVFLVDCFFNFFMPETASDAQDASCHHVLEEVAGETPHRQAYKLVTVKW